MAGCFGQIPVWGLCLLQEEGDQGEDDKLAGKGLGTHDPPVLAVDTCSPLTALFGTYFDFNVPLCCVSKLSWDKGFCCVLSISLLFFSSSPPLEIILCQAVPAQNLFITGFILPSPFAHTPPPILAAKGVVSLSAYEMWLIISAQMLQPWPPYSPAAQGSSGSNLG